MSATTTNTTEGLLLELKKAIKECDFNLLHLLDIEKYGALRDRLYKKYVDNCKKRDQLLQDLLDYLVLLCFVVICCG